MVFPRRFFWVSLLTCLALGLISGATLDVAIISAISLACCLAVAFMFVAESIQVIRNGHAYRTSIAAEIKEIDLQTADINRESALLEISNAAAVKEIEQRTAAIYRETALIEISNAAAAAWEK